MSFSALSHLLKILDCTVSEANLVCFVIIKAVHSSDERAGNLTIVLKDKGPVVNVKAQLTLLVRGNYSNPPAHGARIVAKVLSNPQLTAEWYVFFCF